MYQLYSVQTGTPEPSGVCPVLYEPVIMYENSLRRKSKSYPSVTFGKWLSRELLNRDRLWIRSKPLS